MKGYFISFNLIYWTPICGKYVFKGSILEKCGKIWKNGRFSGRLWPDWGYTTRAAMAGLGSIGLMQVNNSLHFTELFSCCGLKQLQIDG